MNKHFFANDFSNMELENQKKQGAKWRNKQKQKRGNMIDLMNRVSLDKTHKHIHHHLVKHMFSCVY